MDTQTWIALAALALAVGGLLFNAGAQWQKLQTHADEISALKLKTDDLSHEASGIATLRALLEEVRQDVKALMTGRMKPAP